MSKKRLIPLVLALVLLCTLGISAAAQTAPDATIRTIAMTVGADETQRNLTWFSDVSASAQVQYAEGTDTFPAVYKTAKATAVKAAAVGMYSYKTTMVGLESGKTYLYRIVVGNTVSKTYQFTVRGTDEGFTFAFVTDVQVQNATASNAWKDTLAKMEANFPEVAIIVSGGDQVQDTGEDNFEFFLVDRMQEIAVAPTVGPSHDTSTSSTDHYNTPNRSSLSGQSSSGTNYYYTYQNVLFINLNVEDSNMDAHVKFVEDAIGAHPECQWRIVQMHYSMYSGGEHCGASGPRGFRETIVDDFARLGIDAVLSGHDHVYARSNLMVDSYTVSSDVVTNNTVTDPAGVMYLCGMTGSMQAYDYYTESFAPYIATRNEENRRGMVIFDVTDNSLSMKAYFCDTDELEQIDEFTIYKTTTPAAPAVGYDITYVTDPDATLGDATDLSLFPVRKYVSETPDEPTIYMPKGSIAEGGINEWSWEYYTMDGTPVDSFVVGESYVAYLHCDTTPIANTLYIANVADPTNYVYTWKEAVKLASTYNTDAFTLVLTEDIVLPADGGASATALTRVTLDMNGYSINSSATSQLINLSSGTENSVFNLISSKPGATITAGTGYVFYTNPGSSSDITFTMGSADTYPITVNSCSYLMSAGGNFKHGCVLNMTITGGTYNCSVGIAETVTYYKNPGSNTYNVTLKDATFNLTGSDAHYSAQCAEGVYAQNDSKLVVDGCVLRNTYSATPTTFFKQDCYKGTITFTNTVIDGLTFPASCLASTTSVTFGAGTELINSAATFKAGSSDFASAIVKTVSGTVLARSSADGALKVVNQADAIAITWANPLGYTDYWAQGVTPVYLGETTLIAGQNIFDLVLAETPVPATASKTYAFKTAEGYPIRHNDQTLTWQVSYDGGETYRDLAAASYAFQVDVDGTVTNYGASTDLAALLTELDAGKGKNIRVTLGMDAALGAFTLARSSTYNLTIDLAGFTLTMTGSLNISASAGYNLTIFSSEAGGTLTMGAQYIQPATSGTITIGSEAYKNCLTVTSSGDSAKIVNFGQIKSGTMTVRFLYSTLQATGGYGVLCACVKGGYKITALVDVIGCDVTVGGYVFTYNRGTPKAGGNGGIMTTDSAFTVQDSTITSTSKTYGLMFGDTRSPFWIDRYFGKFLFTGTTFNKIAINGDFIYSDNTINDSYYHCTYYTTLPADYDPTKTIVIGPGCSFTNYGTTFNDALTAFAAANVSLADGVIFAIEGNTVKTLRSPAGFNFYDCQIGGVASATPILSTQVSLGEIPVAPTLAPMMLGNKVYHVGGWIVYDAQGNEIGALSAVTSDMVGKTYTVCPVWQEVAFGYIIVGAGSSEYVESNVLTTAVNGKTVILLSDASTDQTLSNVTIDLNGHSLTVSSTSLFADGTTNFIYNSNTTTPACIYANGYFINNGKAGNAYVYVGYSDASTKVADSRITLVTTSSLVAGQAHPHVFLYRVDLINRKACQTGKDSYSTALFTSHVRSIELRIEECNFYAEEQLVLLSGSNSVVMTLTVKNSNFYGKAYATGENAGGSKATLKEFDFDNVHFYGAAAVFGHTNDSTNFTKAQGYVNPLDETCTFDTIHPYYTAIDGLKFVPSVLKATVAGVEYTSRYKYGTDADIKAIFKTLYRNVNIDVNINFNLYVPEEYTYALEGLSGATVTGTKVIGGKTYTVLTVKQAPKDAITPVAITLFGGLATYSADVVGYASSLLKLAGNTEYVTDSQQMAQYVLYYIKTTAVAADASADVSKIDALLGGFALTEEDKALTENVGNTENLGAALAQVYLDLASNVGIVLEVKEGFVGTITVEMLGIETITKTYETAAGKNEFIIISDIPVYDFRNMITVSVDGAVVGTYNLATYVSNKPGDVAYAVYAYSKAAYDYQVKYGDPTTVD